jgi:DNA-binding SARP family transcriptional activator/tetratricopeptide (TPR) repeat protein
LALLALLAAGRNRPITRDRLIALFWPDRDENFARHSLAQLVYGIRQQMGEGVLTSSADDLQLDHTLVWSDVEAFEEAVEKSALEEAAALYAGPFLDGFYIDEAEPFTRWAEEQRQRLAGRHARVLDALASDAGRRGEHARAAEWLRVRAVLEPLNSDVAIGLMRAMRAAGDVAGAIRHASVHESLLRHEVEAAPPAALVQLTAELRAALRTVSPPSSVSAEISRTDAPTEKAQPPASTTAPDAVPQHRRWLARTLKSAARYAPATRPVLVGAIALGALAVAGIVRGTRPVHASERTPVVVVGSVSGSDTLLALAVREALRAELESDPRIRVLSEADSRQGLRLMERSADSPLSGEVASELGLRLGATVAVVGSVTPLGRGVQIIARALDPSSQQAIATITVRPLSQGDVITELSRLSRTLRDQLAKRPPSARGADPLPLITTSSLAALREYARARLAVARNERPLALQYAEAALAEDSLFALAHFLAGDLLWFYDHQAQSAHHLERAVELSGHLPLREQLVVRARYEQIVKDRPDTALLLWERLRAVDPNSLLALEGMSWAYRALGEFEKAAAAADTALRLDSLQLLPSINNRIYALLSAGDTAAALSTARRVRDVLPGSDNQARYFTALERVDWAGALGVLDDTVLAKTSFFPPYRQTALLAAGRVHDAAPIADWIRTHSPGLQWVPRSLIAQARADLIAGGDRAQVVQSARTALTWVEAADLSAPAIARLTERICELAAQAGDAATIIAARRMMERRDDARGLRSFRLAMVAADAALAFVQGDFRAAVRLAQDARVETYHGRSFVPLVLLEADSRRALGEREKARALYEALLRPVPYAGDDLETWAVMRPAAEHGLRALNKLVAMPHGPP